MVASQGDAYLSGSFAKVDMYVASGDGELILQGSPTGKSMIRANVPNGRFKGKVVPERLFLPGLGLFHHPTSLTAAVQGRSMSFDIKIKAGRGVAFR
jgi:hypothetical protein